MFKHIVSFSVLVGLLISILSLTVPIKSVSAAAKIYIRVDGSIDPASAPISTIDMITYSLTADIYDSIVIERNSIVLDGSGHKLQGTLSQHGVYLPDTNGVTVKNMNIEGFNWGIFMSASVGGGSSNNIISDNTIKDNGDGIVSYGSTNCLITRNRITGSTFQDGIWLYRCFNIQIVRNDISGNKRGGVVIASFSENNIVTENNITANVYAGIMFDWESNKFFHNNLIGNGIQAISPWGTDYTNVWDDGYPSGGNYWSDYTGIDSDGDGIGETPYIIDENNRDNYPLTNRRMFVIPVLPFGGLAAALMMFATLGIYKVRVRRKASSQLPRALLG